MLIGAWSFGGDGGRGRSGDGGAGGAVSNIFVASANLPIEVNGGHGGNGEGLPSARGGAGGSVTGARLGLTGLVDVGAYGISVVGGGGGTGVSAGGSGGNLAALTVDAAASKVLQSAGLFGGQGGDATGVRGLGGVGGVGGAITGVSNLKDLNSSINIISAGNGGKALSGTGGAGGTVAGVASVGLIGKPASSAARLGAFDEYGDPQGIFAGRGGAGSTAALGGLNGSVINISARQIAAIGANPDASGLFAPANRVQMVRADVIGFDVAGDGLFNDSLGGAQSPSLVKPTDGFVIAKAIL
jgi:hypothetical protein